MLAKSARPSAPSENASPDEADDAEPPLPGTGLHGPPEGRRIDTFAKLRMLWREDREFNRGSYFTPGFQALAVHRYGVWARELEGKLARRVFRRIYFVINWFVRSFHGIELPAAARIGRRVSIGHQGGIVIHAASRIGDECLIRHNVTIGALRAGAGQPVPRIGDRVEIGVGAVILGGITVGDDAVIGANAVVRVDVPSNAVVLPPEPTIVIRRSTERRKL